MKVLWLTQYPYPESDVHPAPWLASLAKELVKNGISLTILSYYGKLNKDEYYEKDGISFIFLKVPTIKLDFLTLYQLRIMRIIRFVKQNYPNYDIVHVHGSEHQLESGIRHLSWPNVLSVQGIIFEYCKALPASFPIKKRMIWRLAAFYEKRNLRRLTHFICRTHWDKGIIKTLNPSATIHEVWEVLRPDFFSDINFSNQKYILFVGGTNVLKGILEALKVFHLIKNTVSLKLLIVGGGSKSEVKEMITKNDLNITDSDFLMKGFQDAPGLITLYKESFCLLHPSYIDNSPNSVCEAQVAGLPVIASNVGGVSSIIDHNKTGLLTNLNCDDIAKEIIRLYSDKNLYSNIVSNAKEAARKRHDPKKIAKETIEVYKEIIKEYKK